MYAPQPHVPIGRTASPIPGGGPSYYGAPPVGRPISRGPSPSPAPVYYNPAPRPISRGPSPSPAPYPVTQPTAGGYSGYGYPSPVSPPVGVPPTDAYRATPGVSGFHVEKRSRSPNPYGRPPSAQPEPTVYRDELLYREQVSALISAKDHQIAVSGRIPVDPAQLTLFFRGKPGITYSLDFPIDLSYNTPQPFDVLVAACRPRPRQISEYDNYGPDREGICYPPTLPLVSTLELSNYPILDAVRGALFPVLTPNQHLTAVRDELDVINAGSYISSNSPAQLRKDQRVATIIVTLPVRYQGGIITVRDSEGREDKFVGNGGKPGNIEWVAFRSDCSFAVEPVQSGCMMTMSYGVYMKSVGPSSPIADTLITPSDKFFDFLSPILNASRGRSIAFYLNYDYEGVDPAETTANTLVTQLKGADALLFEAFKFHKLTPELHWTAGGYVWAADKTLELFGDDPRDQGTNNPLKTISPAYGRAPFGNSINGPSVHPVRGAFGSFPDPNYGADETETIRMRVQQSGGVAIADANITLLTDYKNPAPSVGREKVFFVSKGELEKLVVNVLLVVYVP
ncbi:hypothetical protein D9613_010828 [Agrocybe pediades]|uniref:Uncharacterized protein n=1 Tax=Agrocybe pediades TaxID=84607 RepID=A0A8H4QMI5_9AGAR|nr:hypothetical protein D9613_010828 [Agrocybe pediades]